MSRLISTRYCYCYHSDKYNRLKQLIGYTKVSGSSATTKFGVNLHVLFYSGADDEISEIYLEQMNKGYPQRRAAVAWPRLPNDPMLTYVWILKTTAP